MDRYIAGLIIALTCFGCLEPFTFDIDEVKPAIIVDGTLDNTSGPHKIKIANVNEFGLKVFDGIGGATVTISDGRSTYNLPEAEVGIYELPEGILTGVTGDSYQLNILLSDGTEIISPMETMPIALTLDETKAEFTRELVTQPSGTRLNQNVIKVKVSTILPERDQTTYLRYSMDEVYSFPEKMCTPLQLVKTCYVPVSSNSQDFAIFNSNLVNSGDIKDLLVSTKRRIPKEEFTGRHYFSVYQHVISRDAYLYWDRVEQLINQKGTVFDLPPAPIPGNLSSTNSDIQVLGYFEVSTVEVKRDFITRGDYLNFSGFQPPCVGFGECISACCQCLEIENSTRVRPAWF